MAEPFKNIFNEHFYRQLANNLQSHITKFDSSTFVAEALNGLEELELKQRVAHTVVLLHKHLPDDFRKNVNILKDVIVDLEVKEKGLVCFCMADYVAAYGLDDFDFSLDALEHFTVYSSAEFAIRPFIMTNFDHAMKRIYQWSKDENHHVRRLSSEGSRPRLPWGPQLKMLMENPEPIRPILENLKADESLYVRKSVANHLNDITKDNPDWMLDLVEGWDMNNERTAWIVKHAARSLIKQGHPRSFALFGFEANPEIEMGDIELSTDQLNLGEELTFKFDLKNVTGRDQKLAIDYAVYYMKKSGKPSRKVFKLKELSLKAGAKQKIGKKQLFKDFTTRKHYPGSHSVEIQINGMPMKKRNFELKT